MKNIIVITSILLSLVACKKDITQFSNGNIVGKWKLSESRNDIGNGIMNWQPADSLNPSYLEFKEDGTLTILPYNVYSADHFQVTSDSTIIFMRGSEKFNRGYHYTKSLLHLYGGCIETCEERLIPAQ